ncbi:FkbM family methyltransferase [Polynucleobacter sp. JS-JIR-II-50]|uniref:FkbM family methyltransferase n=1 Tax=Polynucleobacter sp. JS-JIR-II-50 TaxID=2576919 RepID=UPI001BFE897B|nr:FkbM family methyltransferase [Polynucleobacter sp. JS-JIR-II-50]QWE04795.1 FkbM family methyltransferase [Polynucleobacter sp. JS-JIR-II-50]
MRNLIKKFIRNHFDNPFRCYGQSGEDLVLDRLLNGKRMGFYIDVGAHHPTRFSNTYLFYKKGWSGINIDANPKSMELFNRRRSRDINIEVGIAKKNGLLTYYQFNEPALNTFNEEEAQLKNTQPYHLVKTVQVPVKKLGDILREYLPPHQMIDFLTIDVEGFEMQVLESNYWDSFRPMYILVEILRSSLSQINSEELVIYLSTLNYAPVCKIYDTMIFKSCS